MKDYYSILGVSNKTTEEDIKKAFRKKAMDYHPDRNKDDPKSEDKFKEINVIYGARAPELLLYKDELAEWEAAGDVKMHITVDGTDDPDWKYNVGFVPTIAEKFAPPADPDTYAIVCGPPAMIRFTQPVLDKLGYDHNNIINSLEKRMKCGIGICGRCNIGEKFVCKDGPVFTLDQLNNMPAE